MSIQPGSKLDKVHKTCSSKSHYAFIRIRIVCNQSGWSWNGLDVDFMVFTYWGGKLVVLYLSHKIFSFWAINIAVLLKIAVLVEIYQRRLTFQLEISKQARCWLLAVTWWTGKTVFLIADFTHKNSTSWAKSCTAAFKIFYHIVCSMIEYSWKRRNLKWSGCQLVVDTSSKAPTATKPWRAYTILNKVAARHATQPKIFVQAAWYIIDILSKFQLVKQRSAQIDSLARRAIFRHGAYGRNIFFLLEDLAILGCS